MSCLNLGSPFCVNEPFYISGCVMLKSGSTATTQHVWIRYSLAIIFLCLTCHQFCQSQHQPVYLVWLLSSFSGIMMLVIGVIIPPYADSISLNPLRSTLCHAWLTCLRWCQVLAVSRRLPYATVLLSPPMSVKRMSTWAQNTVHWGTHAETQLQWQKTHTITYTYTVHTTDTGVK